MLDSLDTRLQEAEENKYGYLDFLSLLIQDERSQRDSNQVDKLLRLAGFGVEKTFEGFDFRFNERNIPPNIIRDLMTCHFADMGKNIVISGPPGIGKTHIAKAIGHEMCRRKKHVLYRKLHDIFKYLLAPRSQFHYEREYKRIIRSDLLIMDDFALRKYDSREIEMLYSIVDDRQGLKSIILTSNRPPEDWLGVFPDPVVGGALLDRLVSGAIKIMVKQGRSYRKDGDSKKEVKKRTGKK